MRTIPRRVFLWALGLGLTGHLLIVGASRTGWHSEWARAVTTMNFGAVFAGPLLAGMTATVFVLSRRYGIADVIRASGRSVASDVRLLRAIALGAVGGSLGAGALGIAATFLSGTGGHPTVGLFPGLLGGVGFVLLGVAGGAAIGKIMGSLLAGPTAAIGLLVVATFMGTVAGSAVTRPADATSTLVGLRPSLEYNAYQFVWFASLGVFLLCLAWVRRDERHPAIVTLIVASALLAVPTFTSLRGGLSAYEAHRPELVCDRSEAPAVCVAIDHDGSLPGVAITARAAVVTAERLGLRPKAVLVQVGSGLRIGAEDGETALPADVIGITERAALEAMATDAALRCHPTRDISDREALAILIIGEYGEFGQLAALPLRDADMGPQGVVRIGNALADCRGDEVLNKLGVAFQ